MIVYKHDDLLDDPAEALVNTVNEVGVMGKGIALMFKERFPENALLYERACKAGEVRVGRMHVTSNPALWGPRWIINFPTKKHWRNPSKLEWVREGLRDLIRVIIHHDIRSIALPPLGCGNGGLEWAQVKQEIEAAFAEVPEVEAHVYAPTDRYLNSAKREGVRELTPARAIVVELVRQYSVLGLDCTNLEVQKLAWFAGRSFSQLRLPDPLNLNFTADRYGPYADNLRHLLNNLDGSYLHCEKRLSDAGPMDLIWFDAKERNSLTTYLASDQAVQYAPALKATGKLIDGFESPLGMELLATVDWLIVRDDCYPSVSAIRTALAGWAGGKAAGRRKLKLFEDRLIQLAIGRLTKWYAERTN